MTARAALVALLACLAPVSSVAQTRIMALGDSITHGGQGFASYRYALWNGLVQAAQPDFVLIHLGTNDIGQQGAAGVANADANLRLVIQNLRAAVPDVAILLARVVPIGPGTSYFANAAQVGPLHAVIDDVAADLDLPASPIDVVDLGAGFDLGTMMQSDGLHPGGEQRETERHQPGRRRLGGSSIRVDQMSPRCAEAATPASRAPPARPCAAAAG